MIFVIYGDEPYLIQEKIKEIINENKESEIVKLDGNDKSFSIENMLESLNSFGLFSSKSLILVKNPPFLITKCDDRAVQMITNYIQNPSYENDLILYTLDNSFNSRLKLFKDIQSNAQVIVLNKLQRSDFYTYARCILSKSNLNIDKEASNLLINSVNFDITLLMNNIEVLSLYPGAINLEVLQKLISLPNDEDVFGFINALTSKNVSAALQSANRLLENEESVLRLISTIAAQLRFLYQVAYYNKEGKTLSQIIQLTGAKEFRIKKANEALSKLSMNEILRLFDKLADLDYKCKMNNDLSEKLNLELLIVSMLEQ